MDIANVLKPLDRLPDKQRTLVVTSSLVKSQFLWTVARNTDRLPDALDQETVRKDRTREFTEMISMFDRCGRRPERMLEEMSPLEKERRVI